MLLHDERSGRDVGKHHSLRKTELKNVAHIPTVLNHSQEAPINIAPAGILTTDSRQRIREMQASSQ